MLRDEVRLRDVDQGRMLQLIATDLREPSQTFDLTNDLRERLASLEARLSKH